MSVARKLSLSGENGSMRSMPALDIATALTEVMRRYDRVSELGALRGEGGERAFRGMLVGGFLYEALGWPWGQVVSGESFDLLLFDWRDFPRVYIETKTPDQPLAVAHRREIDRRLHRWGSINVVFLTNGRSWERFDEIKVPLPAPTDTFEIIAPHDEWETFFSSLEAKRYLR